MSVTIYDIANHLNISASTVSRVMNHSQVISNTTSAKIIQAAKDLGYVPRKVKKHSSRAVLTLKLLLSPKNDQLLPIFYDFTDLIKGIEDGASGVRLNLAVELNDGSAGTLLNHKKSGNIDGVIFAFTQTKPSVYQCLEEKKIPFISINRIFPNYDYVCGDNYSGIQTLVEELIKKHSAEKLKVGFLYLQPHNAISTERLQCLTQILNQAKIPFDSSNVLALNSLDHISLEFYRQISQKYNAIIAMNDVIAMAVLASATVHGFRIPKDFSLTGFDNSPVRNLVQQKINTIDLSVYELGVKTGIWIHQKIIQKETAPFQYLLKGKYLTGHTI